MDLSDFLLLPFFNDGHRRLAQNLTDNRDLIQTPGMDFNLNATCRDLVRTMGEAGWLRHCVPAAYGGMQEDIDSRSLCLLRQILASHNGLADFSFTMQGLGSGPISLFGSEALKQKYLPGVAKGRLVAGFALSEPNSGSDAAAMTTCATRDGDHYCLNGTKTWISNAGIADFYCVFAKVSGEADEGITGFVVDADTLGLRITNEIEISAPHPIGTLHLENCRIPASQRLSAVGQGFAVAMQTLDVFRASVGAAAVGFAQSALQLALSHACDRKMFGTTLVNMQLTQATIADMVTELHSSALLVYRAAWERDVLKRRTTRTAAMGKMYATEAAQRIVDCSVQMHGALGVCVGSTVELLYREVRALRIYEGATEIQKLVIAKETLKAFRNHDS